MTAMPACFPETVKFMPLIGLKSFRMSEAGGAWRLFVLAKNLAGHFDHIERESLRAYAKELGISEKQFTRWMNAARGYDLFTDVQRKSGEWMMILTSNKKAAAIFGCEIKDYYVTLPAKHLFSKGWKAFVFASWQAAFTGNGERLVSQKKQAAITGISEQVQREYNKTAGVTSKKNYAVSNIHANGYHGVLEFGNRAGLFQFWDKQTHQKKLGWRIPNTRHFPLFGLGGSYKTRRTMSLFNRTAEQHAASMKALRKSETLKFPEIYVYDRNSQNGNGLWIHLPLN